jgi:hypothetical protein
MPCGFSRDNMDFLVVSPLLFRIIPRHHSRSSTQRTNISNHERSHRNGSESKSGRVMHTDKYICIHGHFYQPPRENPWLEEIEIEESAYPFHDWNERITNECYAPNAASRILGPERRIITIVNNFPKLALTSVRLSSHGSKTIIRKFTKRYLRLTRRVVRHFQDMDQPSPRCTIISSCTCKQRDKKTEIVWE